MTTTIDPKFKLGDRVLVAAVLRRRHRFDRDRKGREMWDEYGKAWEPIPSKRLRGIVVGKRNLSDGISNGNVETWRRYTERRRFGAYIVAFNLSARHEYVLPEHLLLDTPENRAAVEVSRTLAITAPVRDEDIIDAEIVEEDYRDAPF